MAIYSQLCPIPTKFNPHQVQPLVIRSPTLDNDQTHSARIANV